MHPYEENQFESSHLSSQYGTTQARGPSSGARGYRTEFDEEEPLGFGTTGSQERRRRRNGMFVRTARWLGDKLQRWAEGGARRFERAGERARHFAEEGGERAQGFTDREQRRVAHWSERAGRGIQRAGQEVEHLGSRSPYGYEHRMAGGPGGTMRSRHIGRGPKEYRRSDERIREEACEELTWADIDASDIDVSVESGEVTLSGAVPRREWKRLAEDLIAVISGVQDVQNNLRVRSPEAETSSKSPESSFPGTLGEATHH